MLLGDQHTLRRLVHVGAAFDEPNVSVVLVISERTTVADAQVVVDELTNGYIVPERRKLPLKLFAADPLCRFQIAATADELRLIRKIESIPKRLRHFTAISRGEELGKKHLGRADRLKRGYAWILVGEDVGRYFISPPSFVARRKVFSKDTAIYRAPKIVVVKTGEQPVAALDHRGSVTMQSLYNVQVTSDVAPEVILGLLNSRLVSWLLRRTITAYKKMFPQFNQEHFAELPVPDVGTQAADGACKRMQRLVLRRTELASARQGAHSDAERRNLDNSIRATDRAIDQLVYDLYGLTDDERRLVEESLAQ